MAKVASSEWKPKAGIVDLIGEDGSRISLPIDSLSVLIGHARRVMSGFGVSKHLPVGGFRPVLPLAVAEIQVSSTPGPEGPRIVLVLDPGTDLETHLSLELQPARAVAAEILAIAEREEGTKEVRQ